MMTAVKTSSVPRLCAQSLRLVLIDTLAGICSAVQLVSGGLLRYQSQHYRPTLCRRGSNPLPIV